MKVGVLEVVITDIREELAAMRQDAKAAATPCSSYDAGLFRLGKACQFGKKD